MQEFFEGSDPEKKRFEREVNLLFFRLSELVNDPPTTVDFYDWRSNVNGLMKEIKRLSPKDYERLDDLVEGVKLHGEKHVGNLDTEQSPTVIAHGQESYFASVAMLDSEINQMKKI